MLARMLGDVAPWVWGEVCRHLEAELPNRRDLSPEAQKGVLDALSAMLHAAAPREWERTHPLACTLCGRTSTVGLYVRGDAEPGGGARFSVVRKHGDEDKPRAGDRLVCWDCLYYRVVTLESRLALARKVLIESKGGARFQSLFDKVMEQRLIRSVAGAACALCGHRGTALRGPPGVPLCLSCCDGAQEAYEEEQRAMEAERRRKAEDFDRRVEAYLAEMWKIAREDAAGAVRALERRGDIADPRAPPAPGPPAPEPAASPEDMALPEGMVPRGAQVAKAVIDRIQRTSLVSKAASWWRDSRPTAVSLGWKWMERDEARRAAAEAAGEDTESPQRGAPRVPEAPRAAADRWSAGRGRRRPPIPPARGRADRRARDAIQFLDDEVERALRHERGHKDLMGDRTGIHLACVALDEKALSRPMLERFLQSISMLRQVHELRISFYDYTGDELINEVISDYEHLASRIAIGVHGYVETAMAGGLVVSGGTREERARVAGAIGRVVLTRTRSPFPGHGSSPFQYVEADTLYSMSPDGQEEVRRRILITPPVATVFGCDDLDRFIEETPKRCSARIVTYLFMNGQEHLSLSDGRVHVGPPPPAGPLPER